MMEAVKIRKSLAALVAILVAAPLAACSTPNQGGGTPTGGTGGGSPSTAGAAGALGGQSANGGTPSGGAAGDGAGSGQAGAGGASGGVPGNGGAAGAGATSGASGSSGGAGKMPWVPSFTTRVLSQEFYAEGADVGDIDGDGVLDLVAGPLWYKGPEFTLGGKLYDAPTFPIAKYSPHFLDFVDDVNADGRLDVIAVGEGGTDARWYENPGKEGLSQPWPVHTIQATGVGNEAPAFLDVTGDSKRELVFMTGGRLGYAAPGANPSAAWTFHPISPNLNFNQFTHGLGVGDIDGDGKADVVERTGWWRQGMAAGGADPAWEQHEADFRLGARGGAQMPVYDVDGDGDNDVVTSLDAHGYGLSWFEQRKNGTEITFSAHEILPTRASDVSFSQLHALAAVDLNGDGLLDIVTGKRYYAHAPPQDPGGTDPPVLYWFELKREGGTASFVPHLIHDDSGVGCVFAARDVNGDGKPDIFVSNKKGTFLHLQR